MVFMFWIIGSVNKFKFDETLLEQLSGFDYRNMRNVVFRVELDGLFTNASVTY